MYQVLSARFLHAKKSRQFFEISRKNNETLHSKYFLSCFTQNDIMTSFSKPIMIPKTLQNCKKKMKHCGIKLKGKMHTWNASYKKRRYWKIVLIIYQHHPLTHWKNPYQLFLSVLFGMVLTPVVDNLKGTLLLIVSLQRVLGLVQYP